MHKVKTSRALGLIRAAMLIPSANTLSATVSMRLAKMSESLKGIAAAYQKEQANTISKFDTQRAVPGLTADQIAALDKEQAAQLEDLLELEVTIDVAPFKLADFTAARDTQYVIYTEEGEGKAKTKKANIVTIAQGQALVPVAFFSLMGDLITE